jgi:hypothetical protein
MKTLMDGIESMGGRLWVESGKLKYHLPKTPEAEELKAKLREFKPLIIAHLEARARGPEQRIEYERKPGLRPCSCDCRLFWQDRAGELRCIACYDPEGRMESIERGGALTWKLWEADMLMFPAPPTSTEPEPATSGEAPRAVQQELFQ